jgi:hypothetical protein
MLEGILTAIFEIFGELILQIIFELLAESGIRLFTRDSLPAKPNPIVRFFAYSLLGAAVGAVSVAIFPHHFLQGRNGQIANLVLTPIIAGAVMAWLGKWRSRRDQPLIGLDRFWCGWGFAFALAGVRYFWCS